MNNGSYKDKSNKNLKLLIMSSKTLWLDPIQAAGAAKPKDSKILLNLQIYHVPPNLRSQRAQKED